MKKIFLMILGINQLIYASQSESMIDSANASMPLVKRTSNGDMAKELANPVSPLISLPFQFNYENDFKGISGNESNKWTLNIQPVIPFELNDEWNLISRTIMPVIRTDNLPVGSGITGGLGDIVQSLFLSPKAVTENGWVWGAGAVMLIPTNSDVSAKKWGLGPTAVALKQNNGWTYGALFNHIWSFGGSNAVVDKISTTQFQPFLTYTTSEGTSYNVWSESLYNWEASTDDKWTVPLFAGISQVSKIGSQRISYGVSLKYNAKTPIGGADGLGLRFVLTFVFPK